MFLTGGMALPGRCSYGHRRPISAAPAVENRLTSRSEWSEQRGDEYGDLPRFDDDADRFRNRMGRCRGGPGAWFRLPRWPSRPTAACAPAPPSAGAQAHAPGGEANLSCPTCRRSVVRSAAIDGHTLLMLGLVVSLARPALRPRHLQRSCKNLPVHRSMREISELIYETCKTYLITQGKFILHPRALHRRRSSSLYFGVLLQLRGRCKVAIILLFSLVGIAGSYGVAWFGIRINTFANSRTAFASLEGKPYPGLRHPAQGRHEHRHAADLASSC